MSAPGLDYRPALEHLDLLAAPVAAVLRTWPFADQVEVLSIDPAISDTAVERTGMEYGAITPVGLPGDWPVLVDAAVLGQPQVVIGAGLRSSKLRLPGPLLGELPGARVVDGLAR